MPVIATTFGGLGGLREMDRVPNDEENPGDPHVDNPDFNFDQAIEQLNTDIM